MINKLCCWYGESCSGLDRTSNQLQYSSKSNFNLYIARPFAVCCLVIKSCLTPSDPIECSMPGFSVFHYLPEFAQIHVHWVSDAIQPSQSLSPLAPPALNLSQERFSHGFFQWKGDQIIGSSSGQSIGASASVSVLSVNIQDWFPLGLPSWITFL